VRRPSCVSTQNESVSVIMTRNELLDLYTRAFQVFL
jgi:hypothetical protein